MKFKQKINIQLSIISILLASCSPKKEVENEVKFRLSDAMLKKCKIDTVKSQNIQSEMRLFGKIEPDNNKMAQVYSILGGNVIRIDVELGDYVKKGQVMAVIRSTEVAEFQKESLNAKSELAIAQKKLQVARELNASKLDSDMDVKIAERELKSAELELERMNEVYGIYKLSSGSTFQIIAPISGFIVQKDINQNELLRPDNSNVLFSIAEINEMWVMAYVNEGDISKVKLGYDAEISTLSFPDETYKGKIDKIFNTIDQETKAMKVRVRIPNADFKLKPEMNATIVVRNTEEEKMIAVPASAVIFDKSKNWVVVYRNRGDIETRKVEVAKTINNMTYIKHGLKEGEQIISENGILVYTAINE